MNVNHLMSDWWGLIMVGFIVVMSTLIAIFDIKQAEREVHPKWLGSRTPPLESYEAMRARHLATSAKRENTCTNCGHDRQFHDSLGCTQLGQILRCFCDDFESVANAAERQGEQRARGAGYGI